MNKISLILFAIIKDWKKTQKFAKTRGKTLNLQNKYEYFIFSHFLWPTLFCSEQSHNTNIKASSFV